MLLERIREEILKHLHRREQEANLLIGHGHDDSIHMTPSPDSAVTLTHPPKRVKHPTV